MSEIGLTNFNEFKEGLIDKVKLEFVNLIPKESMDAFVTDTIKNFEEFELKKLIMDTLREHVKEQVKSMLTDNAYGQYNHERNMHTMQPEIEDMLIKAAPGMFAEIMRATAMRTMQNAQNNIY